MHQADNASTSATMVCPHCHDRGFVRNDLGSAIAGTFGACPKCGGCGRVAVAAVEEQAQPDAVSGLLGLQSRYSFADGQTPNAITPQNVRDLIGLRSRYWYDGTCWRATNGAPVQAGLRSRYWHEGKFVLLGQDA